MRISLTSLTVLVLMFISQAGDTSAQCGHRSGAISAGTGETGCDLCGCYLGPDPNYNFNSAGIRYKYRHFNGVDYSAMPQPLTDHSGHSHGNDEAYNTVEAWGRYYFSPVFQVYASMPFSNNSIGAESYSGPGDLQLQARYQIFNTEVDGSTKFRNRLFLGGGVKLPTGVFNEKDDSGEVVPHFQPGTGSFDFLLLGTYFARVGSTGFNLDAVYRLNTKNSNGYIFGNQLNINGAFTYDIQIDNGSVIPFAGLYYEQAPEDKSNGAADPNSGGYAMFWNLGLDFTLSSVSFRLNYQAPFYQKLNGVQPPNDYRFVAGASYSPGF